MAGNTDQQGLAPLLSDTAPLLSEGTVTQAGAPGVTFNPSPCKGNEAAVQKSEVFCQGFDETAEFCVALGAKHAADRSNKSPSKP